MWTWQISSGTMFAPTGQAYPGYSGNGPGLNNPDMCTVSDVGPLPPGTYTIGDPVDDLHVGFFALPLTPDPSNQMFKRFAFFLHGDNPLGDFSASDGCIVLARPIREAIAASPDKTLVVEA